MRDGILREKGLHVPVIELRNPFRKRESSDILPYLSRFRPFFPSALQEMSEIQVEATSIPFKDLECVTQATVEVFVKALRE